MWFLVSTGHYEPLLLAVCICSLQGWCWDGDGAHDGRLVCKASAYGRHPSFNSSAGDMSSLRSEAYISLTSQDIDASRLISCSPSRMVNVHALEALSQNRNAGMQDGCTAVNPEHAARA